MYRVIDIFGDIEDSTDFVRRLEKIVADGDDLLLMINSGGGKIFHAFECFDALTEARAAGCRIKAHVCGACCSSAVVLLAAASSRTTNPGAVFHLHPCRTNQGGEANDLTNVAGEMKKFESRLAEALAMCAGAATHEQKVYRKWISEAEWFSAQQAVDAGLVDRIEEEQHRQDECDHEIASLADLPADLRNSIRADVDAALSSIEANCRLGRKAIHRSTAELCYRDAVRESNRLVDLPNVSTDDLARATAAIDGLKSALAVDANYASFAM